MPHRTPEHDHANIEVRLMIVAEMLERAVAEVHRVMAEIQGQITNPDTPPPPQQKEGDDGAPRR